jgi:hypothetical protein
MVFCLNIEPAAPKLRQSPFCMPIGGPIPLPVDRSRCGLQYSASRGQWVTDLPPARVGVSWYALRMWVELGFRALKAVGWQWQHTRRTDPRRTARHWLVLAVATLWVLAHGTRAEDA